MKKLLLLAAISMVATQANASKARLNALGNADHLTDVQDVLERPDRATMFGEFVTFEFGTTSVVTTTTVNADGTTTNLTDADKLNAEGGFVRMHGDSAWGAYLGNNSTSAAFYRSTLATAASKTTLNAKQSNPLNLFYATKSGDLAWGAGLFYTSSENKAAFTKQSVTGLVGSMTMGAIEAKLLLGLGNMVEDNSNTAAKYKLEGTTTAKLHGAYRAEDMYYYAQYDMSGAKLSAAGSEVAKLEGSGIKVGVTHSTKKDAVEFFYGAEYMTSTLKNKVTGGDKLEVSSLPLIVGLEADAANWLTFRGSVKQSVFVNNTKETPATGTANPDLVNSPSTEVAAGVGMKWNKFTVDGTLKAATSGNFGLDGDNFLGNVAMTYNF